MRTHHVIGGPARAPVIVLAHSLGVICRLWDATATALRDRFRVLRYDVRGHGASEIPPGPYTLEQMAGDVRELLDRLGIDAVHVVGMSMGGLIAMAFALAAPARTRSLVGKFSVKGLPARVLGWAEVAAAAHAGTVPGEAPGLEDLQVFGVSQSGYANGTHAVVIEVDPETGAVAVLRWVVAHDCGRVLQPALVEGQIHGAMGRGIPEALNDQLAHDETGRRLAATLMDYALATAADAPREFVIRHLESPTPLNPLGAKGAGEGGIMPVHPLIAQAVENALAPFGARVTRVPVARAELCAIAQGWGRS